MAPIIPPLLEPYLSLPDPASLALVTGVLGASSNWLALRFLHAALRPQASSGGSEDGREAEPAVVLVSFLRDYEFWRDGAARLGLDLEVLGRQGRFVFADGLGTSLWAGPGRGAASADGAASPQPREWNMSLRGRPSDLTAAVGEAVDDLREQGKKVVLVVDQADVLVAATGGEVYSEQVIREMVLDWREKSHAAVLTLSADEPLVAAQTTALERQHASLVLSVAHQADVVLGLRLLDTGSARDVSGVVRVTHGGQAAGPVEEKEYLYHVRGDGGVHVFERGQ